MERKIINAFKAIKETTNLLKEFKRHKPLEREVELISLVRNLVVDLKRQEIKFDFDKIRKSLEAQGYNVVQTTERQIQSHPAALLTNESITLTNSDEIGVKICVSLVYDSENQFVFINTPLSDPIIIRLENGEWKQQKRKHIEILESDNVQVFPTETSEKKLTSLFTEFYVQGLNGSVKIILDEITQETTNLFPAISFILRSMGVNLYSAPEITPGKIPVPVELYDDKLFSFLVSRAQGEIVVIAKNVDEAIKVFLPDLYH